VLVSERTVQARLGPPRPPDRTSILRGILDGDDPIDEALGKVRPDQTVPSQVAAGMRPRLDEPGGVPAPQASTPAAAVVSAVTRVGRNELCPCGSDKKYKKCCGQ
ncbi:MAG: hypothetical protein EOO75_12710, partial [Myxococcales bacterium]